MLLPDKAAGDEVEVGFAWVRLVGGAEDVGATYGAGATYPGVELFA